MIGFENVTQDVHLNYKGETWGSAWGDFNQDTYPDLWISNHQTSAILFRNNQGLDFQDVTSSLVSLPTFYEDTHGAAWADYDGDGDQDLIQLVGGGGGAGEGANFFYENINGSLIERAEELNLRYSHGRSRTPLWLDVDQDGALDLFVGAVPRTDDIADSATILRQSGDTFQNISADLEFETNRIPGCYLTDISHDGAMDLFCLGPPTEVYNLETLPLERMTDEVTRDGAIHFAGADFAFADFNGDLKIDVFVPTRRHTPSDLFQDTNQSLKARLDATGGEEGFTFETTGDLFLEFPSLAPEQIFVGASGLNPGAAEFSLLASDPSTEGIAPHTPGQDVGLYIGRDPGSNVWQIFWSNSVTKGQYVNVESTQEITAPVPIGFDPSLAYIPDQLFLSSDQGLVNASGLGGMTLNTAGVNATTGDFDNDEDVDIYVVSATFTGNPSNVIYENQGDGTFVAIPHAGGAEGTRLGQGDSVSTVDYDLDGYLDVFITNGGEWSPQGRRILDEGPNELFRNTGSGNHWLLIDLEGVHANRDGIGSRLELTAGGRTQLREQNNGIHARTQNHQRIHFGLGQNEIVDKLKVFWPNGTSQTLATIQSDQLITITEGVGFDGADRIIGTTISETFLGGNGNDTLNGRSGNDTLSGESGRDRLLGESGEDYLTGGAGRDTLLGGANNDTLLGQSDHDLLKGLAGNDNLSGGAGNDTLIGGPGQDRLRGGVGRDRFTFEYLNQGVDRILDFNVNQDLIELDGSRFPGNLELGQLLDSAFQLGSSAVSGQDRVIYDQNTGSLFFDPDGDGAQSQRLLLVLTNRSDLSARNIRII